MHVAITGNVSAETNTLHLGPDDTGFSSRIVAGGSLGGGTLTLQTKDATQTGASFQTLDTLAVGDSFEYRTGGNTIVTFVLSGATSPSATLILQPIR